MTFEIVLIDVTRTAVAERKKDAILVVVDPHFTLSLINSFEETMKRLSIAKEDVDNWIECHPEVFLPIGSAE